MSAISLLSFAVAVLFQCIAVLHHAVRSRSRFDAVLLRRDLFCRVLSFRRNIFVHRAAFTVLSRRVQFRRMQFRSCGVRVTDFFITILD